MTGAEGFREFNQIAHDMSAKIKYKQNGLDEEILMKMKIFGEVKIMHNFEEQST